MCCVEVDLEAVSGARWPVMSPGESYRAVLVVLVLVVTESAKPITFSFKKNRFT